MFNDADSRRRELYEKLLSNRVTDALRRGLGAELVSVKYHCLCDETDGSDLTSEGFYLGGEVEVVLAEPAGSLHITWEENAGWNLHFSVCVKEDSIWREGVLQTFPADHLKSWRECIGLTLSGITVYELESTPCVVVLIFGASAVAIGSVCGGLDPIRFGDGDDVYVERFDLTSKAISGLNMCWEQKHSSSLNERTSPS